MARVVLLEIALVLGLIGIVGSYFFRGRRDAERQEVIERRVEVDYCKGAWCVIAQRGGDGWVNANYLTADRYNDDDRYSGGGRYYDDDDYYDDDFYIDRPRYRYRSYPFFRSQACFGGPNTSFCFRD